MGLRLSIVLLAMAVPWVAHAISFDRYHSQEEINGYLKETAAAHPSLVRLVHLGYSERGRDIYYTVVSKRDPESVPALYMNGTHHGNEKSSTEAVVGLLDYLVKAKDDPTVDELLSNYSIYLQPLVNPDGHALGVRSDTFGRDPNRDYDGAAFKVASIRLVKELTDRVRFRAAAAFHSGMEAVLWPWCHTPAPSPDVDIFYTLSRISAEAMGVRRFLQSYNDYPTRGEFIDYVYNNHGTLALTFEVSAEVTPAPSKLAAIVRRSVAGAMAFMLSVMDLDQGALVMSKAPEQGGATAATLAVSPDTRPRRIGRAE